MTQPQYGIGSPMPMSNFKAGGLAELAEQVRSAGRGEDTILAHINPTEARLLKSIGGSGTINPRTGLPEYGFFKSITKPFKSAAKSIAKAVAPVLKPLAPFIPFMTFIPGVGPLSSLAMRSLLTGIATGLDKKGGFDLKKAALAGGLTYGLGSLAQGSGDPTSTATGGVEGSTGVTSGIDASTGVGTGGQYSIAPGAGETGLGLSAPPSDVTSLADATASAGSSGLGGGISPVGSEAAASLGATPPSFADKAINYVSSIPGAVGEKIIKDPIQSALMGTTAYGQYKSMQELDAAKDEAERILRDQEREKAEDIAWAQGVLRDYPTNYTRLSASDVVGMASGGLAGLNAFRSGGQPRFLAGGGDGMSDDIPASIEGKQKAALSDGEFVIPADVVSHLGNGSSRAGAKKLYSMMADIRQARTGKKGQAPEVNAAKYMPA